MATFLTSDPFRMKPTHLSVNPQAFADKKKKVHSDMKTIEDGV